MVLAVAVALSLSASAKAASTTYTGPWAGGTIPATSTVVLADGAAVTGNITANGTLQFAQSGSLTIATTLSGTGMLAMANTGTLTLSRVTSGTTATLLDLTASLPQGTLVLGTNAVNDLAMAVARSSTITIGGGVVRNASAYVASIPPSSSSYPYGYVGGVTITGGTWANGGDLFLGASGTGSLTVSGGYVSLVSATLAPSFAGALYSFAKPNGIIVVSGGTMAASGNVRVGASGTGRLSVMGGVVVVGGTLSTGASGTVTLGPGGTLRIGTGGTAGELAATFATNGTLVFDRGGTAVYAGDLAGTGSVVKAGPGTVVLSGSNVLAGPTSVTAGTLQLARRAGLVGGDPSQWTASTIVVADRATLALSVGGSSEFRASNVAALASLGTGSAGFLNGSSLGLDTTNAPGGVFALTASLANPNSGSNALGLVKLGSGTLVLSGSNAYTGPTAVRGGTLLLARRASLSAPDVSTLSASRIIVGGGATLAVAVGGTDGFTPADVDAMVAIGTGSTGFTNGAWLGLDTSLAVGGTFSYSGSIHDTNGEANPLGIAKLGDGTLLLSSAGDWSGGTLVSGGALRLTAPQAISTTGAVTVASGTLELGGGSLQVGAVAGSATGTIVPVAAGLVTLSSSASANSVFGGTLRDGLGTLALAKLGSGTLTLGGSNGYTGPTAIQSGAVQVVTRTGLYGGDQARWTAENVRTGSGAMLAVNVGGPGEFTPADVEVLVALGTPSSGFAAGSTFGLDTTNAVGGTFAYARPIANPNGGANGLRIAKFGPGTLVVSGSNTFTGGIDLVGGVVSLGSATPLGSSGLVTFAGGTLQYTAANAVDYSGRFSDADRQAYAIDTNGRDVAFAAPLTSASGSLTKSGLGILTLSASSSYAGGTTILGGTLAIAGGVSHPAANLLVDSAVPGGMASLDIVGGSLADRSADIGLRAGATATVNVRSGTWSSNAFITIGGTGVGVLAASNAVISGFSVMLGNAAGGTGHATLASSRLDVASGYVDVGVGGDGSLSLTDSTVASTFGQIGFFRGSTGTVTLSNSVWQNSWDLSVGSSGTGMVQLLSGSIGTRDTSLDGGLISGSGAALVAGGTWSCTRKLSVGYVGAGSLAVTGGVVRSASAVIGDYFSSSVGLVTVTGGTFATSGNLAVGARGTGRLLVGSGGAVIVGGTLSNGASGTIVLDPGGTLQVGDGQSVASLAANVTTNGTLVLAVTGSSTCNSVISGSGSIVKSGAGVLSLTAASGLTGPVSVQQGGVRLAHSAALGAATVTPLAGGTVSLAPRLQATVGGLAPTAGGLIDVGNGSVTVVSGLSNATLLQALVTGRGDGTWNGSTGIVSSVARANLAASVPRTVGWLDNGDGSKSFAYAAPGDTNLDWQVDILDGANFLAGGKFDSGAPASWKEGDFGYDGVVDILDAADLLSTGLFDAGGYNGAGAAGGGIAAVPEPSMPVVVIAALVAAGISRLRRSGVSR